MKTERAHSTLFLLILALGIFARTWEFGQLPPGVDIDEAATAVDAYDLYKYGVDRNGMAFPVEFVSWGEGQNALYAYLLIPFFAVAKELSPVVVRLPMLLAGVASLPLAYLLGKALLDSRLGLLSMFFLAISPWHILLSRWGKEVNLFPFVFLAGFVCLLKASKDDRWFVPGCILLGLCLYAYGTSYVTAPIFLLCVMVIGACKRLLRVKIMILGLSAFAVLAAPIAALIVVNMAQLHSINVGPFTIPRFPSPPRFENQTVAGDATPNQTIAKNLADGAMLLATQSDGIVSNAVEPFGYFYSITLPFALLGPRHFVSVPENRSSFLGNFATVGLDRLIGANRAPAFGQHQPFQHHLHSIDRLHGACGAVAQPALSTNAGDRRLRAPGGFYGFHRCLSWPSVSAASGDFI